MSRNKDSLVLEVVSGSCLFILFHWPFQVWAGHFIKLVSERDRTDTAIATKLLGLSSMVVVFVMAHVALTIA